jgi:hypothetical protein
MFFTAAWPPTIVVAVFVMMIVVVVLMFGDRCCRARHGARSQNYELNLVTYSKSVSKSDEAFATRGEKEAGNK